MNTENQVDLNIIKIVNQAVLESDNMEVMSTHLTQLLVTTLGVTGCAIYMLNPETEELEILASFGLSVPYLHKGPLLSGKSIRDTLKGKAIVIKDTSMTDLLQYPEKAQKEGIQAIVSLPIQFKGNVIGELRIYHHTVWGLSDQDTELLQCLADIIGLALSYVRVRNAFQAVKKSVDDVHTIWL